MAKKVGIISINLVAGTAQFNADLGKAKAKVIDFGAAAAASGHGTRASMIEASAAIRAMEGNFNNNIRAVERFTSITLGLINRSASGEFRIPCPMLLRCQAR